MRFKKLIVIEENLLLVSFYEGMTQVEAIKGSFVVIAISYGNCKRAQKPNA